MSKRNFKRLLKKQYNLYKNRGTADDVTVESDICVVPVEDSVPVDGFEPIDGFAKLGEDFGTPCEKLSSPKLNFREKLKKWYIETAPSRKCLEKLLAILQEEGLEVPLSAAALLGKKDKVAIKKVFPGSYCHIGVENQLKKVGDVLKNYDEIELDINIDGIPLFKSSRIQLWPILLKLTNLKEKVRPFPVGIYVGHAKPSCVTEFCKDFVEEVLLLKDEFILNEKKMKITLRCLTCDTPAKAFVCGVPGHTASHGCTKCTQVAKKVGSVLTYSTVCGTLISDADFSLRKYPRHHNQKFKDTNSPLEEIGFNMVTQTPLDSMHLIDLGVTRKMLIRIIKNRTEEKTSKANITKMSSELVKLRNSFPKEFPRKPRTLDEIHNWKATEFHQFLAYTGLIVLHNNVHQDIYYEFLLLHCAYRLLSNPRHVHSNITEANDLLQLFVQNFPIVFGPDSVSYNVHNLLHIAASAERYGTLTSFSAYDLFKYYSSQANHKCHSCEDLSKQFNAYKDSSQQQYNKLLEILAEHKLLLDHIISQNAVTTNMMSIFPIKSVEKLTELDALLVAQSDPYIRQIKSILGGNTERNLHLVFGQEIIMNFNVDGAFGKNRLRDYSNVFAATIEAISSSTESSDKSLRAAFQRQKKKFFKQTTRNKQKNNNQKNVGDSSDRD